METAYSKSNPLAGFVLIFAAVTYWISWYLMPDQGTADTTHILEIVKLNRDAVFLSVIIQIISSVAYIKALFILARGMRSVSFLSMCGFILLAVGAMGMCMDAFFHLLAYFMTDASITIQADIVQLMTFMQTKALVFLVPLLLCFFIGSLVMAIGLKKQMIVSQLPMWIFIFGFLLSVGGMIIVNNILGYGRPVLVLTVLGVFAVGQIFMGAEMFRARNNISI